MFFKKLLSKKRRLKLCTLDDTPKFSFEGQAKDAKILNVYDGDTVKAALFVGNSGPYVFNIRLFGIDAPEIRTKDLTEKTLGLAIRDYLTDLILNKMVRLHCYDFDKYGRLLADIYYQGVNINRILLTSFSSVKEYPSKK